MAIDRPRRPPPRRGPDSGTVSVFVADEQSGDDLPSLPVDGPRWSVLAERVLADEGVEGEVEVSILFVDEDHIAELNREFMGHEGATDVLSFPLDGVTGEAVVQCETDDPSGGAEGNGPAIDTKTITVQ